MPDIPYVYFNLGNLYCLSSEHINSIENYTKAIELYPYMGDAYFNRGLVLIYLKDKGIVLRAPSVVAIDKDTRDVVAVGRSASRMLGKTPEGIQAFRPLKNGVIADFDVTAKMIREFFYPVVHIMGF